MYMYMYMCLRRWNFSIVNGIYKSNATEIFEFKFFYFQIQVLYSILLYVTGYIIIMDKMDNAKDVLTVYDITKSVPTESVPMTRLYPPIQVQPVL